MQIFFNNGLDQSLILALASTRSDFLINIFKIITFFGSLEFIVFASFVILLFLYLKQKKGFIIPFVFVVVGANAITYLVKILVNRPRPLLSLIKTDPFSFPSGHATAVLAFYGYLAYMLVKLSPHKYKRIIIFIASLIIIVIGFSRLYLGVHYFSDVIIGYLIALVFLIIGVNNKSLNKEI